MATRLVPTLYQTIDGTGNPGNGWLLYFYATGTTTPKYTYSDEALTVANANPVVADSSGRFGDIFGANKEDYKIVLKDASGNTIETEDPIDSITYNINSFGTRPAQHWGTTTNTADAYQIKPVPSITAYANNLLFSFTPHLDNNASCTFSVFQEGTTSTYLSALTMKKYDGDGAKINLEASDLEAGQTYLARIDTTDCIVLNSQKPYIDLRNSAISKTPSVISNGTDTEHDIDLSIGYTTLNDFYRKNLASVLTKKIDVDWVAGDDAGGFPSGLTLAVDTWYRVFVIYNPTTGVVDAGFDTSDTASNLLADATGYTKYSHRGWVKTDGSSNIMAFFSDDDNHFVWGVGLILDEQVTPEATETIHTLNYIPKNTRAKINVWYRVGTGANQEYGLITEIRQTNTAPSVNLFNLMSDDSGVYSVISMVEMNLLVSATSTIRSRFTLQSGNMSIFARGWKDLEIK